MKTISNVFASFQPTKRKRKKTHWTKNKPTDSWNSISSWKYRMCSIPISCAIWNRLFPRSLVWCFVQSHESYEHLQHLWPNKSKQSCKNWMRGCNHSRRYYRCYWNTMSTKKISILRKNSLAASLRLLSSASSNYHLWLRYLKMLRVSE